MENHLSLLSQCCPVIWKTLIKGKILPLFSSLLLRMFDRLKQKWKVGPGQLTLILLTFAIGGSLTGFIAKKIMNVIPVQQDWLWAIIYILLITILWPMAVILISIPFGQFPFFRKYLRKMAGKLGIIKPEPQ